jgi:hypothetical protein
MDTDEKLPALICSAGQRVLHLFSAFQIRVYPCPSVVSLTKPLICQGLLAGWTATVSETVSKAESHGTIRHYLSELAETLPLLAFTNAVDTGLVTRFEQTSYEN